MRLSTARRAVLLFLAFSAPARPAESWLHIRSQNFEMYSTAGERAARDCILHFERVRNFFERAMNFEKTSQPVRIIAFRNEKEFQPYRFNDFAAAYYLPGPNLDHIVMSSAGAEHYPVATHEYVHMLIRHARGGDKIPVWLNEGLAEVFATLRPVGNKVRMGDGSEGRSAALTRDKWINLETLLTIDHKSSHYNEKNRAGIFYAQSWLLTHMLFLSDDYRPRFSKFLAAIVNSSDPATAVRTAYGKSLADLDKDLNAYHRAQSRNIALFDIRLEKAAEIPTILPATEFDSELVLANLLAANRQRDLARERLDKLAAAQPTRPEPHEALAYMYWRTGDPEQSYPHFANAAKLGNRDPRFFNDYLQSAYIARRPNPEILSILNQAVTLNPDDKELRWRAAVASYNEKRFGETVAHLNSITRITPDRAHQLFLLKAYSLYRLNDHKQALAAARKSQEFALAPADKKSAEDLVRFLSPKPGAAASNPPPEGLATNDDLPPSIRRRERNEFLPEGIPSSNTPKLPTAQGAFTQFDCLNDRARVTLVQNGETLAFAILDPNSIALKGNVSGPVELTCGPQKGRLVIVSYEPKPDAELKTTGIVRIIEFLE